MKDDFFEVDRDDGTIYLPNYGDEVVEYLAILLGTKLHGYHCQYED